MARNKKAGGDKTAGLFCFKRKLRAVFSVYWIVSVEPLKPCIACFMIHFKTRFVS